MNRLVRARATAWWGLAGLVALVMGFVIPAAAYQGPGNHPYSILNHFVSELGMTIFSPLAMVFNVALIAGGACLVMFITGCRWELVKTKAGFLAGIIASLSCMLVGVFPADVALMPHGIAAAGFFFGGMISVLAFSVAMLRARRSPVEVRVAVAGFVVVSIYVAFIISLVDALNMASMVSGTHDFAGILAARPAFWPMVFLEWLAVLGITCWIAGISVHVLRKHA